MSDDRPWLSSYSDDVPAQVDIPDVTVDRLFVDVTTRFPDRLAVDFFGARTTWAELSADVHRAAAALRDLGVGPGDRVSVVLPNCRAHVVAFHAVLAVGGVVVEHNPTYSADELHDQFVLTEPAVVLSWRNRALDVLAAVEGTKVGVVVSVDVAHDLPLLPRLALKLPIRTAREKRKALTGAATGAALKWDDILRSAKPRPTAAGRDASDIALIMFSGGTTGVPKAAQITHRNLVANAVHGQAWAQFRPGDEVVYGMLPFFHAFGMIFCLVLPALIGATLVAFPNFDPETVARTQKRRPATFVPGVAPMFSRILDASDEVGGVDWSTARLAFSGAMPLAAEVAERWESATGGLLIEGYGMTECSPIALGNPCSPARRRGSLGIPFPNTEMKVVDQDHPTVEAQPNEAGVVRGELCVRGPQVFAGYLGRDDETALVLSPDGWLRTGDIVEVDEAGFAVLVDRVKEMIVVGGFKVFPSVVEDYLRQMPQIDDVAVVGIPRPGGTDEDVVAVVVPALDAEVPTLAEVREFAARRLPHYALPRHLDQVAELPRSMIGKVLRRVVREEHLAGRSSGQD